MKKTIFSSIWALCVAIGSGSWTTQFVGDYFWFTTNAGINIVPPTLLTIAPQYVTFDQQLPIGINPSNPCSVGTSYECLLGFTINQVTAVNRTKLYGSQTPKLYKYTRP